MKILIKAGCFVAFVLLTTLTWGCTAILFLASFLLGLLSKMLVPLAVLVMIFDAVKPGLALLAAAFLCSQYGMPLIAALLIGKISELRGNVKEVVLA